MLAADSLLEKKRRLRRQIAALPQRSVVLAQGESDLLLFPPLRACWSPRGEPALVLLSGSNAKRVVFGAMNLRTGTRLFLVRATSRAADFQAFLALVRSAYRGWHVALLMDEDSSHTARVSRQAAGNITLLWLPTRTPKLNPIETLWGQAKDAVSVNKQYASIDEQAERFVSHLQGMSNQEALRTSGVLSKRFWLKAAPSQNFCPLA